MRYSATELECLAIYKSILYFSHFLVGCHFTVLTDHQALVSLLTSKVLNKRLRGWVIQLMDFDFQILYRPGCKHQDADALSRQSWEVLPPRSDGISIGGDVGIAPHIEEGRQEKETDRKEEAQKEGSRKQETG